MDQMVDHSIFQLKNSFSVWEEDLRSNNRGNITQFRRHASKKLKSENFTTYIQLIYNIFRDM